MPSLKPDEKESVPNCKLVERVLKRQETRHVKKGAHRNQTIHPAKQSNMKKGIKQRN